MPGFEQGARRALTILNVKAFWDIFQNDKTKLR